MDTPHIISLHGTWREMGRQYGRLAEPHLLHVLHYIQEKTKGEEQRMNGVIDIAEKLFSHYPSYLRDFFDGVAETSSLTPQQLRICNAVEYAEACFFCSALVTWNDYSHDHLIFGRNYDAASYSEIADDIIITIYHPDDALSFATIGYAGEIYCVNGFNECGIFLELNNGMPSAGFDIHWDLCPSTTHLFDLMSHARTLNDVEQFFATTQSFSSFIITAADAKEARAYEWCYDGVKRADEMLPDGLIVSTNHYTHPDWQYPVPTDQSSWDSLSRRRNLLSLAATHKGNITVPLMQQIMDTPIPSGGPHHQFTRYQLIILPATKDIWFKSTTTPWTHIPLNRPLSIKGEVSEGRRGSSKSA